MPDRLTAGCASAGVARRFDALNAASGEDGAVVLVARRARSGQPIQLRLRLQAPAAKPDRLASAHAGRRRPRQPGAVVESYLGPGDGVYLTNAVTDVRSAPTPAASTTGSRSRASRPSTSPSTEPPGPGQPLRRINLDLGGRLVRHDLRAVLDGEGGDCSARRAVPDPRRRSTWTTTPRSITRSRTAAAASCTRASWPASRAPCSTAASSSVRDAQKTDAKQSNPNLLLSDRRAGPHAAAARDLRRRRQVHPRRDRRAARRGRDLLPAQPRRSPSTRRANLLVNAFAGEVLDRIASSRCARRWRRWPARGWPTDEEAERS